MLVVAGGKVFNVATEALDLLSAVWWALPEKYRTPYASIGKKMQDLVLHWAHVDWQQAAINIAKNELSDRAVAKRSRMIDRAARDTGYWVSPRGPSANMRRIWEHVDVN